MAKTLNGNGRVVEITGPQLARVGIVNSNEAWLPKPSDARTWYKKARLMRRDPTISLVRRLAVAPALASTWSYESRDDAPDGAVDFIREVMESMREHIITSTFFGCIDFGWQPFELVFAVEGSERITLRKMKPLIQDFTEILIDNKTGAYAGLRQGGSGGSFDDNGIELEPENTFTHAWEVEGTDWYGEALMRSAEGPYDESQVTRLSANTYDRKIAGSHWIVYYPLGSTTIDGVNKDNYSIAVELLQALHSSGSIAIPRVLSSALPGIDSGENSEWKIELQTDGGATSTSFIERQQYLDVLKARAFGLPERAVLEGQYGTKAEAQEHGEMAVVIVEMRHNDLCKALNWHVVNRLLLFNYGPEAEGSVFIQPAPLTDKEQAYFRTLYDKILANADGFTTEFAEMDTKAMRDRLNVPSLPPLQLPTLLPTAPPVLPDNAQ